MKHTPLFSKRMTLFLMPFVICCLSGCASLPGEQEIQGEPWTGEFTGMIDADLEMSVARFEAGRDTFMVKGTFEGEIGRVAGGFGNGTMRGAIKGEVKDGVFNVGINGRATVTEGSARITGRMKGTLSNRKASGTWVIDAHSSEGTYTFSGAWHAQTRHIDLQGN